MAIALAAATLTLASPGDVVAASKTAMAKPRTLAEATWLKRFPLAYLDTAWSSVATRDGHLVIGLQAMRKDDRPNHMAFAKLDAAGTLLWRVDLPPAPAGNGHQSCDIPMSLREAADGSLLVAGTRCNHTYTTYYQSWPYAWFARLDGRARLLWETAPDRGTVAMPGQGMPQSYGWDLVEWPDGGLLGLGLHTASLGYALWRLDISGEGALKNQRVNYNAGFDEHWRGVTAATAGPRGVRIGFSSLDKRGDAHVGWVGRDLEFSDAASVAGEASEELQGIHAAQDGTYCMLYKRDNRYFLQHHGKDDATTWERELPGEPTTRVLAMRDGGCLLAGGIESGNTGLRLARFAADGQPGWAQEIAGRFAPKSLAEMPTGALVVIGYEVPSDYRGSVAFVLRIAPADLGKAGVKPVRR
jgi:hypothetical protein